MNRILVSLLAALPLAAPAIATSAELASRDASGVQGNNESENGDLSGDGRYIAFESEATNLIVGDNNGFQDIYRKDRDLGTVVRASIPAAGGEANAQCESTRISANGRYVFFRSEATNLVANDMNAAEDLFRRDLDTNTTIRVSTPNGGGESNGNSDFYNISPDGRFVVFRSFATNLVMNDTNGDADIFLKDLDDDSTVRVSTASGGGQSNGDSFGCSVSDDGNFVSFDSVATNLVGSDTNGHNDIFHKNVSTGAIVRANTDAAGSQANGHSQSQIISPDGSFVAFESDATDLVPGDTNGERDIFVKEIGTNAITRASTSSAGGQAGASSHGPDFGDGSRLVAFYSSSSKLVPGDTNGSSDCFVKDLDTGLLIRVSTSATESQGNGSLFDVELSADGAFATFDGFASNLVADDTNGGRDAFVKGVEFNHQPDATVGSKGPKRKGNGIYNASGAGQKVTVKTQSRKNAKFSFDVQIDGNASAPVRIRATGKNRKLKPIYKQSGKGNVTAAITRAGLVLNDLLTGGVNAARFKVIVKTERAYRDRAVGKVYKVKAASNQNGVADDAVKAGVKKKP